MRAGALGEREQWRALPASSSMLDSFLGGAVSQSSAASPPDHYSTAHGSILYDFGL